MAATKTLFLAIACMLFLVSCTAVEKEVPFVPDVDFTTLCDSSDVAHINNVVEQHLKYTRSINDSIVWLKTRPCVESALQREEDSLEVRFDFEGERIFLRIKVVEKQTT